MARTYQELIDVQRYPLDELDSPRGLEFIDCCRRDLAATNMCILPGFVQSDAAAEMAVEADKLMQFAYARKHAWNVYRETKDDPVYPEGHPRWRFFRENSNNAALQSA